MNKILLYHEKLMQLILIREKMDADALIDGLYEMITMNPKDTVINSELTGYDYQGISLMMDHFLEREQYEKCAILKQLINKDSFNENS
jgi:hypothetical protein